MIQAGQFFGYLAGLLVAVVIFAGGVFGQESTGTLRGQVTDQQGSVIVGATVEAVDSKGSSVSTVSDDDGNFVFKSLKPGIYAIKAEQAGFSIFQKSGVTVTAGGNQTLKVELAINLEIETVTVAEEEPVSTEPTNNAGGLILKEGDFGGLPENSEDLEEALRALAGPSAGPNGGEILIDGVPRAMPPLSSIREIRINSNPFSAEYDRIGFGRIEVLTKPGSDSFHGQIQFGFNDESMNSRNPFTARRADYQSRQYSGNLSGPVTKKSSFFFDFDRRSTDDLAVINATILDSDYNFTNFTDTIKRPSTRTSLSPRFDIQLNDTNTLSARYGYNRSGNENSGVGGFSLDSRAYSSSSTEHSFSLTETAVINKSVISETRFQYLSRSSKNFGGDSTSPTIQVFDAFTSGGNGVGASSSETQRFEISNSTSWTIGNHSLKAGARLRSISIKDVSRSNFAGTYSFTSLGQYRDALLGVAGVTPVQFTLTAGESTAKVNQIDFSPFIQDDWKILPNLTLNLGLRYEAQTNVSNNMNFAPRVGFAWSPDSSKGGNGKTVIRGGFGVFFDRIGESLSLTADRFDGSSLQSFVVTDPALLSQFPLIPTVETLLSFATPQNRFQFSDTIRSPYNMQTNIGVERQLPFKFVVAANFISTRGYNQLRSRNINAPVGYIFGDNTSGTRPLGEIGNVFQYESTGRSVQNQFTFNVRNNLSRNLSLFAMYTLGKAEGDTDGAGSFPANSYDLSGEYGRSSLDTRHRFVVGGNVRAPFGISLNPFVIVSSGTPFNITTGQDLNGDTRFTERPTFAQLSSRCDLLGLTNSFCDVSGVSDVNATIPRNYGTGNGFATVNLRISKSFGFGGESGGNAAGESRGGGMMSRMGGGSPASGNQKYNLVFSLQGQNLLNTTNSGSFIGNLSSPLFGTSNSLGSGFGFGPGGGSAAYNRRIEASVRFSF